MKEVFFFIKGVIQSNTNFLHQYVTQNMKFKEFNLTNSIFFKHTQCTSIVKAKCVLCINSEFNRFWPWPFSFSIQFIINFLIVKLQVQSQVHLNIHAQRKGPGLTLKSNRPPPLNFSKVETWNSSYLTTQNFKGVDLDWHYNQAGNVLCPADNKANDHCLMSNLLNYFIPLRTPSTHASHWTSSYLFHSWGDVVSYEIIFGLQIHQRSRMLKALFTWGYLDFYASWDNQETTDSESCQWKFYINGVYIAYFYEKLEKNKVCICVECSIHPPPMIVMPGQTYSSSSQI